MIAGGFDSDRDEQNRTLNAVRRVRVKPDGRGERKTRAAFHDQGVPAATDKEDLQIRQKLAARDPGNAQWQTDLVISLWKLAAVLEQQGTPQKREAGAKYQQALEILRPLAVENRLTAEQKKWIARIEARLKAITENSQ
jgi:hypothetical protein